jgi:hypothetical protein
MRAQAGLYLDRGAREQQAVLGLEGEERFVARRRRVLDVLRLVCTEKREKLLLIKIISIFIIRKRIINTSKMLIRYNNKIINVPRTMYWNLRFWRNGLSCLDTATV